MRFAKLSTLCLPALLLSGLATQAHADARAEVLAAFEAAMAKKSYRAVAVSEVGGKRTESVIQMQMPSSFHLKTEGSEVIVLPGGTWMNAGGQWMKLPMDMSKMIEGISLEAMKEGANLVKDVRELGSETIDGCDATNYAYRTDGRVMGFDASADVELAVCDGLPLRVTSVDAKGKSRTTISYDYETPVVIRAPN
jgi:outer membrane lipoprotein-sorting protein